MTKPKKKKKSEQYPNLPETKKYHEAALRLHENAALFLRQRGIIDKSEISLALSMIKNDMRPITSQIASEMQLEIGPDNDYEELHTQLHDRITTILGNKYWPLYRKQTGLLSNEELDRLNFIDISSWFSPDGSSASPETQFTASMSMNYPVKHEILEQYLHDNPTYAPIPCFEEGLLLLPEQHALQFRIKELDPDTGAMTLDLTFLDSRREKYCPVMAFTVYISAMVIEEDGSFTQKVDLSDPVSAQEASKAVPKRSLKWGPDDYESWSKRYNPIDTETYKTVAESQVRTFLSSILCVNYILSHQRASSGPRRSQNPDTKPVYKTEFKIDENPMPKIWTIGGIKLRANTRPKAPRRETIIKYRVAAWSVAGHVRHYKSGKTIYIKPHDAKRKGLDGSNTGTSLRQRGIVFKNSEKDDEA